MYLVVLLCYVVLLSIYYGGTRMARSPMFLSRGAVIELLKKDPDQYMARLSATDLVARQAATREAYLARAVSLATDPSPAIKTKITAAINQVSLFPEVPWKIALMKGEDQYEGGHPHTRMDTIFLTETYVRNASLTNLANTLLHEKVHVFQKKHNHHMQSYFERRGFQRTMTHTVYARDHPLVRANPDTDGWIWKDRTGKIMATEYRTSQPRSITDTNPKTSGSETEHPWEWMAYSIAANNQT